jgi:hypothetical protein
MGYTIICYVLIFDFQDWQFVQLGEQQNFGIKTAGLEDKATACQMLVCYARSELGIDGPPIENREINDLKVVGNEK